MTHQRQVYFFTKGGADCPSSRQRAFLVVEKLREFGMPAMIADAPPVELISTTAWPQKLKLILRSAGALFKIKKNDAAYLQRTIYNKYFFILVIISKLIRRYKIIFDFDDSIFIHSFFKTVVLVKLADGVIVGSHYLKEWAEKFNRRVYLIPTSVDFGVYSKYTKFYSDNSNELVIGWAGNGPAHFENLKLLVLIFSILVREEIKFKFLLVGAMGDARVYDLFQKIEGLKVEFIDRVSPDAIAGVIQKFDVGLMPLTDDEWSRGKCALKALEYMAAGIPAIVSPVGENIYVIEDGVNGFAPKSTDEFVSRIKQIFGNRGALQEIGRAARETVRIRYSFEANVPKIAEIINKL